MAHACQKYNLKIIISYKVMFWEGAMESFVHQQP